MFIQRAKPYDLATLTRLAVAPPLDDAWTAVVRLLRADFRDAIDAVIATPWDDLPGRRAELCPPIWCDAVIATPWDDLHPDVQTLMLSTVDDNPSSICAAIAFACGAALIRPR